MVDSGPKGDFERGEDTSGSRWIKGTVTMRKGHEIYVDSRTGVGVVEILSTLDKFFHKQAHMTKLKHYDYEDIVQEIRLLALIGIPGYDTAKKASMSTFLQNHVKNRIINLYKFASEKKRVSVSLVRDVVKVKCPKCKALFRVSDKSKYYTCGICHHHDDSRKWRKYNFALTEIPFSSMLVNSGGDNGEITFEEAISDIDSDMSFLKEEAISIDRLSQIRIDFLSMFNKLSESDRELVKMVIEGCTYKEIESATGVPNRTIYTRVHNLLKNNKIS